jgi:PEP-CTERM motif-containing protein
MLKPSRRLILPAILTGIAVLMATEPAHAQAPIPEPATLTLFGAGAAAIGVLAWWRKRK